MLKPVIRNSRLGDDSVPRFAAPGFDSHGTALLHWTRPDPIPMAIMGWTRYISRKKVVYPTEGCPRILSFEKADLTTKT